MSQQKRTLPYDDVERGVAVDTLIVEVVEGPDEGKQLTADKEIVTIGTANGNDFLLTDPTVSRYHVELERTSDGVVVRDHASTNGTLANGVRLERASIQSGTSLRIGRSVIKVGNGEPVKVAIHQQDQLGELRGRSEVMRRLMAQIEKAARTEAAVLVVGESGTGKELIARALHDLGRRTSKPFITVDCGAMSQNLVASELFGHERGAFTGADRQHVGAFERANGGTIFLDEIGELPAELQPNLLGALERKRFRRVGGRTDIDVDVRVIAATNRDLRSEVNAGRFRLDLYYRLAVVTLAVAPLRKRGEDIPLLVEHFLKDCGHEGSLEEFFPPNLMDQLRAHQWPGNVRELRNMVEATLAMGEAPMLINMNAESDDDDEEGIIRMRAVHKLAYKEARAAVLHEFEANYLKHWLDHTDGNVAKAAREARMDRSHMFHLLRRHKLR